ncbi:MAG: hypothetical protein RIB60_08385 [Phycisphaerales bacterium]
MASINPTSASVIRPFPGAVNARAQAIKNQPAETQSDSRKVKLGSPDHAQAHGARNRAERAQISPINDGPLKASGVAPAEIGEDDVIEPLDLSNISERTDAVLQHTIKMLMDRAGINDAETLTATLSGIIEPLVASDGVPNAKAATAQYIKSYIAEMQADADGESVGLKSNALGKSNGLDLEG